MNQHDDNQDLHQLDGEPRGIPSLNQRGPSTKMRGLIVLSIVVVLGCVFGGYLFLEHQRDKRRAAEAEEDNRRAMQPSVPTKMFDVAPEAKPAPVLPGTSAEAVKPREDIGQAQGTTAAAPATAPPLPGEGSTGPKVFMLDKSASSVSQEAKGRAQRSSAGSPSVASGSEEKDSQGGMATMLTSTKTAPRKASFLPNRNFLLAKGAFIDCALQTRLDTTVAGMTACVVTRDIYSDNGKVLLIEGGSTVTGEYQSNMKQGQARIYVLWNRIKTQNGVVIPLDSPGADQLGGSGVPGYIDTHFWQRFGGALMLSLVDDVARGITSQTNSGSDGNQFNFTSTGDATQNMAAEALRNTINIPPTLYRNQGGQVGIYVARDLDFSGVYDVAAE